MRCMRLVAIGVGGFRSLGRTVTYSAPAQVVSSLFFLGYLLHNFFLDVLPGPVPSDPRWGLQSKRLQGPAAGYLVATR